MDYQYEPLGEEYKFQTFLKDLFNAFNSTDTFEEYGSKGQAQYGIDIYSPLLKTAVQAKKKDINRRQSSIINELLSDLSETLRKIKNFPHPIERLFLATTTKRHIKVQNACHEASRILGINIYLFCWDDIQVKLSDCHSVRNKYYPHLKEATTTEIVLNEKIRRLEILISRVDVQNPLTKKIYREIPDCEILLPPAKEDYQKILLGTLMKIALYQTFSQTKYKKFKCLLYFGMSYTQFPDGTSGPGFGIICGEIIFLANCTRLVKDLQNNPDTFWNQVDQLEKDVRFNKINFQMKLLLIEGLTAYDFEIDGQTCNYNIKPNKYGGIEYEKLDSLSAVLPFIARSTKLNIEIIDLDKVSKNPPFMKLFYHLLKEDTFNRSFLKVNVDNFDDWDYEYNPNDG